MPEAHRFRFEGGPTRPIVAGAAGSNGDRARVCRGVSHGAAMVVSLALTVSACGGRESMQPEPTPTPAPAPELEPGDWQLVWADEFEVPGLPDSTKWSYDVGGHGWGNQELQYYTERRPENARVEGGRLIIEARRDFHDGHEYTSARLVTKGKADWTYGRFEVRARLPSGRGTWPAAWMLASQHSYGQNYWPDNGEIDIMEHVGFDPDVVHAAVHTRAYHHSIGTHRTGTIQVSGARTDFHVYAVEWSNEEIRGFVDDQHYFTFRNERLDRADADYRHWPFDRPFHLLLNIAVGGSWGGAQGVDPNIWPQRLEVEYVRVFQRQ